MLSYLQRLPFNILMFCIISVLASACDNENTPNQTTDDMNLIDDMEQGDLGPNETDTGPNITDMSSDMEAEVDMASEVDMMPEELANLSLNSIVPNRGPVSGGNQITIVGTGFSANAVFAVD